MRKTKLIATLGPATDSPETLAELIRAGVNVFRLNMSHAPHDWCREVTSRIRTAATETDIDVSVLMDLRGPSIRTGDVETAFALKRGDTVEFRASQGTPAKHPYSTDTNYPGLGGDLTVGNTVLVDNGMLHMKVLTIDAERVVCEVLTDGTMGSRRHINLPGVRVNLPSLTDKDHADIDLAVAIGADFVALSFVRDAEHVTELKEILGQKGSKAQVVSKIEDQEAIRHLDGIITASDAVMVARGDLGIEVQFEELPIIQRDIVRKCVQLGRKVIVATHMLESMIENPVPTRAEVTDVANAVFEQADAIMLSGETSVGAYPVRCVEVLDKIARRVEREPNAGFAAHAVLETEKQKIVKSAIVLANSLDDAMIVVFTKHGVMAHFAAQLRPERAPIFAFCADLDVCRALNLSRAVTSVLMDFPSDAPNETIARAIAHLREQTHVAEGTPLVIISDVLQGEFAVDAVLLKKA